MNKKTEELLLKCTSMIHAEDIDGEKEQATCFFIKNMAGAVERYYLVTNRHVLEDKERIHLYLDIYHKDKDSYTRNKKVTISLNHAVKFHDEYDLAILDIGFLKKQNTEKDRYVFKTIDCSMIATDYNVFSNFQDIFIVGYPSGIYDTVHNLPVTRKGMTATPIQYRYKNREEFLIDFPFLNGSSGSPIFAEVEDKVYLVGVEYSKILEKVTIDSKKNRLYHSRKYTKEIETGIGIAVKADVLLELIK